MTTAVDPVCKMKVDTRTAQWKSEYKGETYYFCAPSCQRSFEKDPEKYISGESEGSESSGHEGHHH